MLCAYLQVNCTLCKRGSTSTGRSYFADEFGPDKFGPTMCKMSSQASSDDSVAVAALAHGRVGTLTERQ